MVLQDSNTNKIRIGSQLDGNKSFGGKADGLIFLQKQEFHVPRFFVLDHALLSEAQSDSQFLSHLIEKWKADYSIADASLWAVRSSAGAEDGIKKSYAGQFRTELNVTVGNLHAAVQHVLEGFAKADKQYDNQQSHSLNIVLQEMIVPEYSGVAFSLHPVDGSEDVVFVNVIPGLGSALVSGEQTALSISIKNNTVEFECEELQLNGVIYAEHEEHITVDVESVKKDVAPFLKEIEQGVRKLQSLRKHHVDVEFAISNGGISWLQVRPVTVAPSGEKRIWDNSNIGENYPGLTMPLTISLAKNAYGKSYGAMGTFLGAGKKFTERNRDLLFNMVGGINGAMYYHVTAWQQLLYQLPFGKRSSKLITKMWGADEAAFSVPDRKASVFAYIRLLWNFCWAFITFGYHRRKYLQTYPSLVPDYSGGQLAGKSHPELIAVYRNSDAQFESNWAVPMLNGFYTLIVFSTLKKRIGKSRLAEKHSNFINDILFSSKEVISVTIVREYQALLKMIRENVTANKIFTEQNPNEIAEVLPAACADVDNAIKKYIQLYGERCEEGELRMEAVNFKEDPIRFLSVLKSNLQSVSGVTGERKAFDYKSILRKEYRWNIFKRVILSAWIRSAIRRVRDRENFRFMRTRFFSMIRCIFRAMDAELLKSGWIDAAGDSLFLEGEEILDASRATSYREIIMKRKQEYVRFAKEEHAPRYVHDNWGFTSVVPSAQITSGVLKGTGCCSGTVTGEVRIVDAGMINDPSLEGKIVIAKNFEPGWINLFSKAKGLISERGSLLSHTAILCRELGVPSIVGASGITKKIKDGDIVRMNGATGEISIKENE